MCFLLCGRSSSCPAQCRAGGLCSLSGKHFFIRAGGQSTGRPVWRSAKHAQECAVNVSPFIFFLSVWTVSRWSRADPPDWVPDEACNSCIACKAPFTVIRRKHHCRSCGKVRASFSSVKQSSWQESRRWSYCCGNRWLRAGGPWLTRCFVLCRFRSSALAAPPTLHLCPATVRWSRSGCAHTATCSTSRPFTVTKLASDYSNYHRNKIKKAHSPLQHGRMQQTNLGVVYKASATLPESGPLRLTEHQDPRVTDWRWETPVPQSEPQTWLLCPADINHSKMLVWLRLQKQKVYEGAVAGFDWSWGKNVA